MRYTVPLFMIIVLLLGGCGNPVREKIESEIVRSMPEVLGPAQSYQVRVYGPTTRLMKGKLDGVDITGIGVRMPEGITVQKLDIQIRELVVNTDTKKIERATTTRYSASVAEADLALYLKRKYPDVPGLQLDLHPDLARVFASPGVAVARVGIQADGKLLVKDRRALALDLTNLRVAGINAPGFASDYLASRVDTVFDARDLGFDAHIDSATLIEDALIIKGDLDLLKAIESRRVVSPK